MALRHSAAVFVRASDRYGFAVDRAGPRTEGLLVAVLRCSYRVLCRKGLGTQGL